MNHTGKRGPYIKAGERDRIEAALRSVSIFEASKITGRPVSTLAKIAEAIDVSQA